MSALRWGALLLLVHTALLFLPPIPPVLSGSSVFGYALSLVVAGLLAGAIGGRSDRLAAWWRRAASARRRALAATVPLALLAGALVFRVLAMGRFARLQREEGLFEPLTLVCYIAAAVLLWRASAAAPAAERRPWRLLAALYVFLALEELDYFSVFGGMIGRIRGEYAGSLHDVVRLTALGIMGPRAWAVLGGILAVALVVLWRTGFLRARWVLERLRDPRLAWALAGIAFLAAAAFEEAHLFGWTFTPPTPEEPIELTGAFYLAMYALEQGAAIERD